MVTETIGVTEAAETTPGGATVQDAASTLADGGTTENVLLSSDLPPISERLNLSGRL